MTKRLLVLDLNRTILHRLTHVPEMKAFRTHPIVLENKSNQMSPWIEPRSFTGRTPSHSLNTSWNTLMWPFGLLPNPVTPSQWFITPSSASRFSSVLEEAQKRQITVRQVLLGPSDKGAESLKERLLEETRGRPKLQFIWTQDNVTLSNYRKDLNLRIQPIPLNTSNRSGKRTSKRFTRNSSITHQQHPHHRWYRRQISWSLGQSLKSGRIQCYRPGNRFYSGCRAA